jgi:D-alanine-D-alanine ligase
VLVEAAIAGRLIGVGVLEGEHGAAPQASVCAEVSASDVPAELPAEVTGRLRELAVRAFIALDCAGLARVDFFVTPDFDVYLHEIDTMPGFTQESLFPRMWEASGLDYPELLGRLIRTALPRGTGLH